MEVNFVKYENKYKEKVINLIHKSFSSHNITDILEDDRVLGIVGLIDDEVVSYLNITFCTDIIKNTKYSIINHVCVDIDYRGNDIGKKMMEEAISLCKENGCSMIQLTSKPSKVVANKMYQSMGFGLKETNVYEKVI